MMAAAYHAHVYFDAGTVEVARTVRREIEAALPGVRLGNFNERPRGPHRRWSFEVAFDAAGFGTVVPWLAYHRRGLVVLVHPDTADEVADHTDRAMWMGEILPLDLGALD